MVAIDRNYIFEGVESLTLFQYPILRKEAYLRLQVKLAILVNGGLYLSSRLCSQNVGISTMFHRNLGKV